MKYLSRLCPEIFKSPLACAFLVANLVACAFILDWDKKVFPYLERINEKGCLPVEEFPNFGFTCFTLYINIGDIFFALFCIIFFPRPL